MQYRPPFIFFMRIFILVTLFFCFSPSASFAAQDIFTITRLKIAPGEETTLSWDIPGAEKCESTVDYLNIDGVWVWTLSDAWHSATRPSQGSFSVKPEKSARYRLSCVVGGKTKETSVIVTVGGAPVEKKKDKNSQPAAVILQPQSTSFGGGTKPETPPQAAGTAPQEKKNIPIQVEKRTSDEGGRQESRKEKATPVSQSEAPSSIPPSSPEVPTIAKKIPAKKSLNKEQERAARTLFLKAYKRVAVSARKSDALALRILAGFDTPAKRNEKIEKKATKTFVKAFKRKATTQKDQKIIDALSYSNAPFLKDTDRDGLSDEDEKRFKSNPRKKDTDGDGYLDGLEVGHGYSPTKPAKKAK